MKIASQAPLSRYIRPGDAVLCGAPGAQPLSLLRAVLDQCRGTDGVRLLLDGGAAQGMACASSGFELLVRDAQQADAPGHLPQLIRRGALRIDVVLVQASPPDALGRHSLGLARDCLPQALERARVVIAEEHPDVPWTCGGPYLRREDIALLLPAAGWLPDPTARAPSARELEIARHVASLVEDGATLQIGAHPLCELVLAQLHDRRELGVHSGWIGPGVARLAEAGVVTNSCKSLDAGLTVASTLAGNARTRRWAHRNPALELRGTDYTHDARVLAALDRFVAINTATEVDLSGQVRASGTSDMLDFVRGAHASRGGVPIVALPASGIVRALHGPVTVPRGDACVVVTEHGIADLRGLSLAQRAQRLAEIAGQSL